ncbi:NAD(P)-dependent oxidoreductase [uncultured Paracoccus sp.]|uniref:2-hydroxyacid dehydrogenase n=1 Tax=uncultured Paracoccus sp. TaxID=189685 RepID=UPI002606694D|nr:NAD(P)-dependent oxidoreductase [uncultured Paracoccus sp.]
MGKLVYVDATPHSVQVLQDLDRPEDMTIHVGDPDSRQLRDLIAGAEIVWNGHTYMSADDLDAAPSLRRIIFLGTGASSYIDMAAVDARGITVETIRGYGDQAVGQHAIALALSALRQIATMDRSLRAGHWEPLAGREFQDLTFGVVGMGGIGRATAELAAALGFRVIGWNRSPLHDAPCPLMPLGALLEAADVISLHLALTPETAGMIDAAALRRMRRGAVIVNTARAGIIDTVALGAALSADHLGHAALDVFDEEPLPPSHPLLSLPNVTVTAHAGFNTDAALRRLLVEALARVR